MYRIDPKDEKRAQLKDPLLYFADFGSEYTFQLDGQTLSIFVDGTLKEKDLPWPQIYEGKGWQTSLGIQHDVSGIPFVLLTDGDTGEILADARLLRGSGLSELIGKKLEAKNPAKVEASASEE